MGRPKEFDPDDALDRAMEVFWQQGFKATSVQDLVKAMGINRGSLYDTFGDKEQLFQRALTRYCDTRLAGLLDTLAAPGEPRTIVRQVLLGLVDTCAGDTGKHGCFLTNSVVELAPHCDLTHQKVSESLQRMEQGLFDLVKRTEPDPTRARTVARYLVGNVQGLSVLSKTAPSREALEQVVDVIVAAVPQ